MPWREWRPSSTSSRSPCTAGSARTSTPCLPLSGRSAQEPPEVVGCSHWGLVTQSYNSSIFFLIWMISIGCYKILKHDGIQKHKSSALLLCVGSFPVMNQKEQILLCVSSFCGPACLIDSLESRVWVISASLIFLYFTSSYIWIRSPLYT